MEPRDIGRALEASRREAERLLRLELCRWLPAAPIGPAGVGVIAIADRRLAIVLDREGIRRERSLLRQGFCVLHFWSHEVLARTPEVLRSIRAVLAARMP
ncbi:MAG: DUF559 domain-containing protein [Pseudomonadota bacterium]